MYKRFIQVLDYWNQLYLSEEPIYRKLFAYIKSVGNLFLEDATDYTCEAWYKFDHNEGLGETFTWLNEQVQINFESIEGANELLKILQETKLLLEGLGGFKVDIDGGSINMPVINYPKGINGDK